MACKYRKKMWIEVDEKEIFIITCDNEDSYDYHSDNLNDKICNEDVCPYFEGAENGEST